MVKRTKKSNDLEKIIKLGKTGNNVKIGIVGLPNVGKSTLFNLLSGLCVPAENYSFCTINPSKAQCAVPDPRWQYLCKIHKPLKRYEAMINVWDIAGLVQGAHEGKGLGNEFLSNIAAVDSIYHVVRSFSSKKIQHFEGDVNPIRDLEIIKNELMMKDIQMLKVLIEKREKIVSKSNCKQLKKEFEIYLKALNILKGGSNIRAIRWENAEVNTINSLNLFTAKPVVYLINHSQKNWINGVSKWMKLIKKWIKSHDKEAKVIPFSAKFEKELFKMETNERENYIEKVKTSTQLNKIIWAGYKVLNLIHFFTCGVDEVKAWTIRNGTEAPQAAAVIHSDFEKNFIAAETMAYNDFVEYGSEAACRAKGRYVINGKTYIIQDGDILFFKIGIRG